jgi:hypothetical protein
MEAVPQMDASGYWIARFHPKSALADFGNHWCAKSETSDFAGDDMQTEALNCWACPKGPIEAKTVIYPACSP